jgi:hypothetical protein
VISLLRKEEAGDDDAQGTIQAARSIFLTEFARTLATKVAADMAEPTTAHMTRSAPSPFGGGKKPHREEERGDATTMSRSLAHGRPGRG